MPPRMESQPGDALGEAEIAVMRRVVQMLGYDPVGMLDLLHILVHPDVLTLTKAYIAEIEQRDTALYTVEDPRTVGEKFTAALREQQRREVNEIVDEMQRRDS